MEKKSLFFFRSFSLLTVFATTIPGYASLLAVYTLPLAMKRVKEENETLHLENARRSPPLTSTHFIGFPCISLFYSQHKSTKKNIYLDLKTQKKELLSMVFALPAFKIFLKLFYQHILLNLSTLITTFSLFLLYIVVTPLMIGFSKDFLCHFHLGLIWICLLFSFLPERFFQNDFEDGTLELYYLSAYCLQKILLSKLYGHWVLQISGVLCSFPVLQLLYQFDQSKMNWFTIIIGSQIFTLMCGIHSCLALGITSNGWNSLQNLTTLPTLLPLIVFCTSIETEWFHVILLMGYLLLFLFFYPILVSITLQTLLAK